MRATRRADATCLRTRGHIDLGTIHTLPTHVLGGFVVFASTQSRPGAGRGLALMLLRALGGLDPHWRASPNEDTFSLHKTALGRPYFLLGDRHGPSLSFSHGGGGLWGAMCGMGSVGIDVAYPEEFGEGYPLARAFSPEELDSARALCGNDMARGAALIWSAKEAAVKATGAGFNLFGPLAVYVGDPLFRGEGIVFEVSADRPMLVWAKTEGRGWLSVALASR